MHINTSAAIECKQFISACCQLQQPQQPNSSNSELIPYLKIENLHLNIDILIFHVIIIFKAEFASHSSPCQQQPQQPNSSNSEQACVVNSQFENWKLVFKHKYINIWCNHYIQSKICISTMQTIHLPLPTTAPAAQLIKLRASMCCWFPI